MSITKTLLAGVAGTVLVGSGALASEPLKLTETQMDDVTAGYAEAGAVSGDVIAFGGLRGIRQGGSIRFSAEDGLKLGTGANISIVERASASASVSGAFRGIGGIGVVDVDNFTFQRPVGVYAYATNIPPAPVNTLAN